MSSSSNGNTAYQEAKLTDRYGYPDGSSPEERELLRHDYLARMEPRRRASDANGVHPLEKFKRVWSGATD